MFSEDKLIDAWLEVSLIVDGELAEAVAEVFARFAPDGVVIESTAVTAAADDSEGRTVGPLRVAAYLPMDEHLEETRRKLEESLWYLGRIRPLPAASYQIVKQADWAEAWKVHYKPVAIGKRLMIVPAWLENPAPGRTPIRIDPGMAFGTGTHPTTQLCLELIEEYYTQSELEDQLMIDVGCGSGILAITALKCGARYALGIDIDPEAVSASRENAQLNQVEGKLELGVGSLAETLAGAFSFSQAGLVVANILAPVLTKLLDEGLGRLVAPGGWLILSGILAEQSGQVEVAMERNRLLLVHKRQVGDWIALAARS
jgi:ribosomal protein L11 methyltransferase